MVDAVGAGGNVYCVSFVKQFLFIWVLKVLCGMNLR